MHVWDTFMSHVWNAFMSGLITLFFQLLLSNTLFILKKKIPISLSIFLNWHFSKKHNFKLLNNNAGSFMPVGPWGVGLESPNTYMIDLALSNNYSINFGKNVKWCTPTMWIGASKNHDINTNYLKWKSCQWDNPGFITDFSSGCFLCHGIEGHASSIEIVLSSGRCFLKLIRWLLLIKMPGPTLLPCIERWPLIQCFK